MPPPRKKDRLRGSLSPVREQFPSTGTLYGGQVELSGKSRPDEGAKTAPGGSRELCAGCAHGGAAGNGGVWWLKVTSLGARRGRGHARAQKQPRAEAGSCAQTAPMGEGRQWEVSGAGKAPHWAHAGA